MTLLLWEGADGFIVGLLSEILLVSFILGIVGEGDVLDIDVVRDTCTSCSMFKGHYPNPKPGPNVPMNEVINGLSIRATRLSIFAYHEPLLTSRHLARLKANRNYRPLGSDRFIPRNLETLSITIDIKRERNTQLRAPNLPQEHTQVHPHSL